MGDCMIKFPPPLDWFQKKLWRIRWIEWMIVLVIAMIFDFEATSTKDIFSFILFIPFATLVYTFAVKYILLICIIYPFKLMAFITGDQFSFFSGIVKFMEAIGRIINDTNNHIIAKFCEEKPKYDPELSTEHLVGK